MKILHVVPGLDEQANGIAVAAKRIAARQNADLIDAAVFARGARPIAAYDEVWVHSMWLPRVLRSCYRVLKAGVPLVRMTHANLDPVRLAYHGWKKCLMSPFDRWLFKRTARVVVTGPWETAWCRAWGLTNEIEVVDLSRGGRPKRTAGGGGGTHFLYLGRMHPLKGVKYLERAVAVWNQETAARSSEAGRPSYPPSEAGQPSHPRLIDLRCVSQAFGAELEKVWTWCDVLVLPTLSENFGLVVDEALERGKRVIVTDGAPAWAPENRQGTQTECENGRESDAAGESRIVYVRGFREGTDETRVKLLVRAIESYFSFP